MDLIAEKKKKIKGAYRMVEYSEYNQRPEESMEDWKYRLILGKARKEVKMNWQEIADMLCLGCSSEYLRKIAYGVLEYDRYIQGRKEESRECYRDTDDFNELENKEMQMRREKMRMQDQKRELNKLLREWARAEHIQKQVMEAVKEAAGGATLYHVAKPVGQVSDKEGALLLSDWHVGMKTANVVNTYNDTVFDQRIAELIDHTVEYGHQHQLKCIHVFALGDLVNGLIHVTTRINVTVK